MNYFKSKTFFASLAILFAGHSNANLILNPGFESSVSNWTFDEPAKIETGANHGLGPNSGTNYGAFTTNDPGGSISQSLNLSAGNYSLSFFLAQRGGGDVNTTVTLNFGLVIENEAFEIATASGVWTRQTYDFSLASNTEDSLTFSEFNGSENRGPGLDDVSLTRVPVPATLALIGLGLAGLGWNRRKKA